MTTAAELLGLADVLQTAAYDKFSPAHSYQLEEAAIALRDYAALKQREGISRRTVWQVIIDWQGEGLLQFNCEPSELSEWINDFEGELLAAAHKHD